MRPSARLTASALAVLVAACGGGADGPGGLDGDGGGPGGGGPDADLPDAPPPADECDPDPPNFPGADELAGDGEDNDCDGLVDEQQVCASGDAAFATLTEAIAATPAGGALEVCAGTYAERLVIDKALAIGGAGIGQTILDAGGAGTAITVAVPDGGSFTLQGFTIRNGAATGQGGGVRCTAGGLTVRATELVDNRATQGGGGLAATGCALDLSELRFVGNDGLTSGGGALLTSSSGELRDSLFVANVAYDGGGVAVVEGTAALRNNELREHVVNGSGASIFSASDAPIEDNVMKNGRAVWGGGGLFVSYTAPTIARNLIEGCYSEMDGGGLSIWMGNPHVIENTIRNNSSDDDGGGVRVLTGGPTFERNVIENNVAAGQGGGVKISHHPGLFVDNVFRGNRAWRGGGIALDNDSSTLIGGVIEDNYARLGGGIDSAWFALIGGTIRDVRIANNEARRGGAIYLEDHFWPVTLSGLVLEGNHADDEGGAVWVTGSDFTLRNSIIAGNTSERGGAIFATATRPWDDDCPCPPVAPVGDVEFTVMYGNAATETGAAVWTDFATLRVSSSIVFGHQGMAVTRLDPEPLPPSEPPPPGEPAPPTRPSTAQLVWRYNATAPATFEGVGNPTGATGNLAVDCGFVDAPTGDFRLSPGSPCVDAGDPAKLDADGSRADMGRFAGPTP